MGKVSSGISMSLDGFVAGPNNSPEQPLGEGGERLFNWYFSGDTPVQVGTVMLKVSLISAKVLRDAISTSGAMVTGRKNFDVAGAWDGHPPAEPTIVVTHRVPHEWAKEGSPFIFVTDGIESAIRQAKQAAGDKNVAVATPSIMQQCLKAGLLDEIHVDLVPVLLGQGTRLFEYLGTEPIELERTQVVEAPGVTHLTFRVVR